MKKIGTILASIVMLFVCVCLAACKKEAAVTTVGVYYSATTTNLPENGGTTREIYSLELFSNGTYEMTYSQGWTIQAITLNYGRDVTSYGNYTVTSDADGVKEVKLDMPTRMQLAVTHRNRTILTVDTANWPTTVNEDGETVNGIEYTLYERAETETWETVEAFIAAYGRAYTVQCDTTVGGMVVVVEGTQIPVMAAVTA